MAALDESNVRAVVDFFSRNGGIEAARGVLDDATRGLLAGKSLVASSYEGASRSWQVELPPAVLQRLMLTVLERMGGGVDAVPGMVVGSFAHRVIES